ncbi:MAG: 30S ribosomal protein S12 methylthiotransferase RimO, partial [Clostridium sp.]|nr:30S ribosomal protein S12 methylthiotransferase RimO [Clostridium sp.]
ELIINNIYKMKTSIDGLCLRTSIIVGFPGETEEEFNELKDFIIDTKFDKLGVFKYSQEEDTPAANMPNQIEEHVKEARQEELMLIQQNISKEKNKVKIGKSYKVIVERLRDEYYYGRNYEMSPEIDGEILFKCDNILSIGDFTEVLITDALEYDLIGVVNYESCQ